MEELSGIGVIASGSFDQIVLRTRVSLSSNGFGILSEMAVPPRLSEGGRSHLFMCVWNQTLSTENLGGAGLDIGDHMVMNIAVFEEDGQVKVAALDPAEGVQGEQAHNAEKAAAALAAALEQAAEAR